MVFAHHIINDKSSLAHNSIHVNSLFEHHFVLGLEPEISFFGRHGSSLLLGKEQWHVDAVVSLLLLPFVKAAVDRPMAFRGVGQAYGRRKWETRTK
ncbi:unnamed protein product [Linum trigynum]|uniref:Uncharacterized protein n=1 Tax=Linum trigynum TaxID=586398 RepID=A0AAV2GIV5_9ROSI